MGLILLFLFLGAATVVTDMVKLNDDEMPVLGTTDTNCQIRNPNRRQIVHVRRLDNETRAE